jgi:cobalt-zinc-cadmium efflux system protein
VGHNHHAPQETKLFVIATTINLLLCGAQAVYALMSHSMILLADAGHNLGDVAGLAMSGSYLLKKRSDSKYSYGFKRTTIMAALLNAILLLGTTLFILFESIHKFLSPVAFSKHTLYIIMLLALAGLGWWCIIEQMEQQSHTTFLSTA